MRLKGNVHVAGQILRTYKTVTLKYAHMPAPKSVHMEEVCSNTLTFQP